MSQLDDEKLFYERFYNLHRDPILLAVFKRFGIEVFRRSCVLEGLEQFANEQNFRGSTCVEIGSCKGLTAVVLSRFFDMVISIDIVPDPQREEIAKFCGAGNVLFVRVNNNAEKLELINGLEFDAAFSDGDHAKDTETDFAMLRKCGRVLFHEYWDAQPAVKKLVDGLRGKVVIKGKFALWTA